jgi:hypothetical protein
MVITRILCSGPKSKRTNSVFQHPDFGNSGLSVGLETSRLTYWGSWGRSPQENKKLHVVSECPYLEMQGAGEVSASIPVC